MVAGSKIWAYLTAAGVALATLGLSVERAHAVCDAFYRVAAGDTLRTISVRELGTEDYDPLFRANRDILSDPSRIEVGQLLYLPCAGAARRDRTSAFAAANRRPTLRDNLGTRRAGDRADELAEAPVREDAEPRDDAIPLSEPRGALRILTGSGLAPLTDRNLPEHGMANLILAEALAAAKDPRKLELAVVDDWKSHLPVLMPTGAFNLALPWPRPDCDAAAPSDLTRKLCSAFVYSAPLYEIQMATLTMAGNPLVRARSVADLADKTICRPESFPPVDLEKLPVRISITTAMSPVECGRQLLDGGADTISLPAADADRLLSSPQFAGRIVKAPFLGASVPVHALALRDAPGSADLIAKIDQGLSELQSSGRWMDVISNYLQKLPKEPPS